MQIYEICLRHAKGKTNTLQLNTKASFKLQR